MDPLTTLNFLDQGFIKMAPETGTHMHSHLHLLVPKFATIGHKCEAGQPFGRNGVR